MILSSWPNFVRSFNVESVQSGLKYQRKSSGACQDDRISLNLCIYPLIFISARDPSMTVFPRKAMGRGWEGTTGQKERSVLTGEPRG